MIETRPERPGLREQVRRTRDAGAALATAHVDLLKAELGVISGEIKTIAAMVGAIVGVAVFTGLLLAIGGTLFVGEWLFGSIGWGVLHGLLLSIGLITVFALRIVDVPGRVLGGAFATAAVIGVPVTLALGLNIGRHAAESGATWAGVATIPPVFVGAAGLAVIGAILGLVFGARSGGVRGAVVEAILAAPIGAVVGAFLSVTTFDWRGAAAIGVTVALSAWPAISGLRAMRAGIDAEARFGRLWPRSTYDSAIATKTWLEQEWTRRRQQLSKR
jgi:hypothetical protein